ncbi:MAG: protein translocase subunit SecD [Gammaproteobacteria bacterium AqS3]|nr:protein translocase subunit SecD [Gammaproteobacteria bacterium AqS3]
MNHTPLWQLLLIGLVISIGVIYALPNLYAPDAALQISSRTAGAAAPAGLEDEVTAMLGAADIEVKKFKRQENGNLLIHLHSADDQLRAREVLAPQLDQNLVLALSLAPTTPEWLRALGAQPMSLGLDLRGGVHFLLEVDAPAALENALGTVLSAVKRQLREEEIRYRRATTISSGLVLMFGNEADRDRAVSLLRPQYTDYVVVADRIDGRDAVRMLLSDQAREQVISRALEQNLITLRNRINELGVAQPVVQRQGSNRIVVQLPGVQDTAHAKNIIGKTANLEFRLSALDNTPSYDVERLPSRSQPGLMHPVLRDVIVTGEQVINATPSYDESGVPQVNISLSSSAGRTMGRNTRGNIGRPMAVIFIEERTIYEPDENGEPQQVTVRDRNVISWATIQAQLGSDFRITGLDSPAESSELALLLRAGSLAAPMRYAEERVIGPSLGQENINAGLLSVQIGFALVLVFMIFYYHVFGIVSTLALSLNLLLMAAVMSILQATLTLPGIAGFVLTVGMAVDANVLIFSRVREELRAGTPPAAAIDRGYGRALISILDANITTLLVAIILYAVGTGSVKGFAVTLSVGILTSIFTAVMFSRAMTNAIYGNRGRTLSIGWVRPASS